MEKALLCAHSVTCSPCAAVTSLVKGDTANNNMGEAVSQHLAPRKVSVQERKKWLLLSMQLIQSQNRVIYAHSTGHLLQVVQVFLEVVQVV